MDYERLGSELFRALRGKRSQAAFGRRLGYRANVAYTWEGGRRFPFASVLFHAAALNKISLDSVADFAGLSKPVAKRAWSATDTAELLRALSGSPKVGVIAGITGSDRTTVARWLRGDTEPRVPQLLAFVGLMSHRLVEFVALFVPPETLPSLRPLARELSAQRRVAYELPWSHAVLRALELRSYRACPTHVPGVIATAIGVDVTEEAALLGALREAGLIRRKSGKWRPTQVLTVDTRAHPEGDLRLKEHWAKVGLERLERRQNLSEAFHSYNLFGVSHADYARLRELHLEYYERVRRIVAESSLAERVVLLNWQLIPLASQSDAARRT